MGSVKYLWDQEKARQNRRKHRVSFEEAVGVFDDLHARIIDDPAHSNDEQRAIIIGYSVRNRLLFVSYTERDADIIRIISARLATKEERVNHESQEQDQT